MNAAATLYLDLLKQCLTNSIYDDDVDMLLGTFRLDEQTGKIGCSNGVTPVPHRKRSGAIWPSRAHTMIGMTRLENIEQCATAVLRDNVPGDLIEAGVWRGGATIFMRGLLKAFGVTDRRVWVADSFQGLPTRDLTQYPQEMQVELHNYSFLAVSLEQVKQNFARYHLLDEQVRFLPGWFRDTLPNAPIERLALLRLDGDMYESTMDGLVNLYPKLSPGGFVIIDDYNAIEACNDAVHDFRKAHSISSRIHTLPSSGAYWSRERG